MVRKYLHAAIMTGLAILALVVAGEAQKIRYNYMPGIDFSRFKTYKWVDIKGAKYPNELVDTRIKQAIDKQLALKGLQRTDNDFADLYVAYQAAVNQQQQWNAYNTGGNYWGWGGWYGWGGMGTTTVTSSTINIGTLNVDVYDVATKKQIWRGEATKTLGNPKTPEKLQKNIDKAMAKLMKNYPPPVRD